MAGGTSSGRGVATRTAARWLGLGMIALFAACAHPAEAPKVQIFSTPKLEILDKQIEANPSDAQAYSNRGYVLALLGRREAARADLQKVIALKDNAPMHNRVG